MTIESNYAIAIAMLDDWPIDYAIDDSYAWWSHALFSTNEMQNESYLVRATFPALSASYR